MELSDNQFPHSRELSASIVVYLALLRNGMMFNSLTSKGSPYCKQCLPLESKLL